MVAVFGLPTAARLGPGPGIGPTVGVLVGLEIAAGNQGAVFLQGDSRFGPPGRGVLRLLFLGRYRRGFRRLDEWSRIGRRERYIIEIERALLHLKQGRHEIERPRARRNKETDAALSPAIRALAGVRRRWTARQLVAHRILEFQQDPRVEPGLFARLQIGAAHPPAQRERLHPFRHFHRVIEQDHFARLTRSEPQEMIAALLVPTDASLRAGPTIGPLVRIAVSFKVAPRDQRCARCRISRQAAGSKGSK